MDDGVIQWAHYGRGHYLASVFDQIEQIIPNVSFERVDPSDTAKDIHFTRTNKLDETIQGVAMWTEENPVWDVRVRRGKKHRSTVWHEIGHVLGLNHPENHWGELDQTVMGYYRDKSKEQLYPQDVDDLTGLWHSDLG